MKASSFPCNVEDPSGNTVSSNIVLNCDPDHKKYGAMFKKQLC